VASPVREALQRLERTGLVEVSPNRYTRVSIPDDKLIGDISLHFRKTGLPERQFEIGWIIATDQQGHGYARESAEGILGLAFDRMHAQQVFAKMRSRNEGSRRLAARLGFVEVSNADDYRVMTLDREAYLASRGRQHDTDGGA